MAGGVGMNKKPVVNIGVQRFDKLRKQGSFYIDKTDFIREWWETGSEVTLITRPRRFGKTLNMSMLECFFSNKYEDRADLFEGLSIFGHDSDQEKYRNLQGKFPVIFLTFANIKADRYLEMENKITETIAGLYESNRYLLLILRILKTGISLEAMPPWVSENGFSSFQAVC